ncbi:hypothetical protein [Tateyamaria sp.]|uniref:hypothetical protein n=1 Tax=Tateyamaria sp. TaxID=1929288 RepID=UPI003B21FEC7
MAKTKGAKPLSVFEHDFIRLMISEHGWSYGQVAKHLKRSRTAIFQAHKAMIRDGTINQLPLQVFEQSPNRLKVRRRMSGEYKPYKHMNRVLAASSSTHSARLVLHVMIRRAEFDRPEVTITKPQIATETGLGCLDDIRVCLRVLESEGSIAVLHKQIWRSIERDEL